MATDADSRDDNFVPEWNIPASGLPVSIETLHLLRAARQAINPAMCETLIMSIVSKTISENGDLRAESCLFVLEYVIAGLSLPK